MAFTSEDSQKVLREFLQITSSVERTVHGLADANRPPTIRGLAGFGTLIYDVVAPHTTRTAVPQTLIDLMS